MSNKIKYFLNTISMVFVFTIISLCTHAQIYLYQKDGQFGLKNYTDSSIITPAIYDRINVCSISFHEAVIVHEYDRIQKPRHSKNVKADFWIVWKDDLCGVVNSKGAEIIPMMRATIRPEFYYGYIYYKKDNNHFLADTSGKLILKTTVEFQQRSKFIYYRDNLSDKTKIINYAGTEVLATDCTIKDFDDQQEFFYGYTNGIEGMSLFDLSGKRIASGDYDKIEFSGPYILLRNYMRVSTNIVYDRKQNIIYKGTCNTMEVINEKYLLAGCGGDDRFIFDSTGRNFSTKNFIFKKLFKEYFWAADASNKKEVYKLYFNNGQLAFDKSITNVKEYGDRYIISTDKEKYLINDAGTIIKSMNDIQIKSQCSYPYIICCDEMNTFIMNIKDGSISLKISKTYVESGYREIVNVGGQFYITVFDLASSSFGLKNLNGELVLPFQYRSISSVENTIAAIDKNGRTSYYSSDMKILYNGIKFNEKQDFIPGFVYADKTTDYRLTMYDRNANVLFRAERTANTNVYNGYYIVSNVYPENKAGIFGMNGEVFVKPQYDAIQPLQSKYWIVKNNNVYGVIDIFGNEIIPIRYQSVSFSENVLKATKDNHITAYRVTSDTLYEVITTTYREIEAIGKESTYFIIKENEKFGIINNKGFVVPPVYTKIFRMFNDMLILQKNDSTYFSSYTEPSVLTESYSDFKFSNPQGSSDKNKDLIVRQKTKYGIVNNQAKVLLDAKYDLINYKGNDLYIVTLNKKSAIFSKDAFLTPMDIDSVFYMDSQIYQNISFYRNGKYYLLLTDPEEKISAPYSKIKKYSNGKHVIVENNNTYGVLTTQNTFTLEMVYQNIKPAGPNRELIIQQQGLYGMASESGTIRIPVAFDAVQSLYSSNYYRVSKNNIYGIYNNEGKQILPLEYDFIQATGQYFMDQYRTKNSGGTNMYLSTEAYAGLKAKPNQFIVKQHNQYGVIDSSRHVLIPIQYDLIVDDGPGYVITKDGKSGYVDNTGKILIAPAYEAIRKVDNADAYYIYQHHACGVLSGSKLIIQPQYDSITYDTERKIYTVMRNDSTGMADVSGTICVPMGKYEFLLPDRDNTYCFIKDDTNHFAIFSFTEKKLLTPFTYRYYKEAYADRSLYFILYDKDTRYQSIYIPGTEGSPPAAEYNRIIFNADLKQFELYYTAKDGKQKYRTYAPKRILSKPMEYKEE